MSVLLEPALIAAAPELAVLDIISDVLETCTFALFAAHPILEAGEHPASWCSSEVKACCLADRIIDRLNELDNAIIDYGEFVREELEEDKARQHLLPF